MIAVVPPGIELSNDPVLHFRSQAYTALVDDGVKSPLNGSLDE